MSRLGIAVTVGITLRWGRRASEEVKIVGQKFGLAKGRWVIAREVVVWEFGEGDGVLFSDPVVNTRVS